MKPRVLFLGCWLAIALLPTATTARGKPPAATKDTAKKSATVTAPVPTPVQDPGDDLALARWLLQSDTVALPFSQVVQAATGKTARPFDPADPGDAAALAKIGAALDGILLRANSSDSPARATAVFGDSAAVSMRFEEELRAALLPAPASAPESTFDHTYPAFLMADVATGRGYYLATTLYQTGGDVTANVMTFQPSLAVAKFKSDGCCLLVGIEFNGKTSREIAFLNWQILDLSRLKMRFIPTFHAAGKDALAPAALLTDGRKGRD